MSRALVDTWRLLQRSALRVEAGRRLSKRSNSLIPLTHEFVADCQALSNDTEFSRLRASTLRDTFGIEVSPEISLGLYRRGDF